MAFFKKVDSLLLDCRRKHDYHGYLTKKKLRIEKSAFDKYRFKFISDILEKRNDKNIIDLGCSCTSLMEIYKKKYSTIFFCDRDVFYLQAGRLIEDKNRARFNFVCADISDLPFKNDYFDTLVCLEVIEHLPKEYHDKALKEILRIARRGATIYISTPNKISLPGLEGRLLEFFFKEYKWMAWDSTHKYIYSAREFVHFIKSFTVDLKMVSGFYFLPGSLLVRLPLFLQNFFGFSSFLLSKCWGSILPLKYLGFTTIIEFKKI